MRRIKGPEKESGKDSYEDSCSLGYQIPPFGKQTTLRALRSIEEEYAFLP